MCFSDECPREAEAADGGPHFENFCYGSQLTKSIFSALAKRPLHSHDNPIITQGELHGDKCRGGQWEAPPAGPPGHEEAPRGSEATQPEPPPPPGCPEAPPAGPGPEAPRAHISPHKRQPAAR